LSGFKDSTTKVIEQLIITLKFIKMKKIGAALKQKKALFTTAH
jgi:hypothetical protein